MLCKKCGKPLAPGAAFCTECGEKIPLEQISPPSSSSDAPAPAELPGAKKKTSPAVPMIAALALVAVAVGGIFGVRTVQKNNAIRSEMDNLNLAISHGEGLDKDMGALFASPDFGFLAEGVNLETVKTLEDRLAKIQTDATGDYAAEVREKLDLSDHKKRIDSIQAQLSDAKEKAQALEDLKPLFETDPLVSDSFNPDSPLAEDVDAAAILQLSQRYGKQDASDPFWADLQSLLEEAQLQEEWIQDAVAAVTDLEGQDSFPQADFDDAQDEILYLLDGTRKTALQSRLDALKDKIVQAPEEPTSEPNLGEALGATDMESMLSGMGMDLGLLFGVDAMNESFDGMGTAQVLVEGNRLTVRITMSAEWDAFVDQMVGELANTADMDTSYIEAAESFREIFPDATVALEFCKSDGTVVWNKEY